MAELENIDENVPQNKPHVKRNIKRGIFIVGMIIIPLLNFCIFYVGVNFNSILMAFQILKDGKMVYSFKNFELIWKELIRTDSVLSEALRNTLLTFGTNLLIIMPLTIFIAYFLYKKIFLSGFFKAVFFFPSIISAVVLVSLYIAMADRGGPLSKIVQVLFGMEEAPLLLGDPKTAIWTVLFYSVWTGFSVNLMLFLGAFNRIPSDVLEAGSLDGVGMIRELFNLILPMVWPTLTTLLLFAFVGIFTASGPILLLTGGRNNTYTISYWIFEQVYQATGRLEYASAVGIFFTLIALPIVFAVRFILNKFNAGIEY